MYKKCGKGIYIINFDLTGIWNVLFPAVATP